MSPEAASERFATFPPAGVQGGPWGPLPAACVGSGRGHVGRIRAGSTGSGSLCFFALASQLRAGAATAALRIACRFPAIG